MKRYDGKIFIDAEQSYFQTAIHRLVLQLQQLFNRERVIVYNTYQCYRKVCYNSSTNIFEMNIIESVRRH